MPILRRARHPPYLSRVRGDARAYAETALELLDTGTARKLLARSLRQYPADARLYPLLAKSLLPKWVLKSAREAKRGKKR